jgi:hypothetical protein
MLLTLVYFTSAILKGLSNEWFDKHHREYILSSFNAVLVTTIVTFQYWRVPVSLSSVASAVFKPRNKNDSV